MTATQVYENPSIDRIFGVFLDKQTYKNIGYMLLSFPLGVLYFVTLVPALWFCVPFMFVLVGFPMLLGMLAITERVLGFERRLLRTMLNQRIVVERPRLSLDRRILARMGERLAQGSTWRGLLYIPVRLAMGIVSLILVAFLVPFSVILMMLPLTYRWMSVQTNAQTLYGRVTTFDQALICCTLGAILALVSVHLFNGWTALWKRVAAALLR